MAATAANFAQDDFKVVIKLAAGVAPPGEAGVAVDLVMTSKFIVFWEAVLVVDFPTESHTQLCIYHRAEDSDSCLLRTQASETWSGGTRSC